MLTRVELLRLSRGIAIPDLVNESGMSRQHLLRIRKGEIEPRRDMIAALVSAFRHLTLEDIQPDDVIELSREESGPWRKEHKNRITADIEAWKRERDGAADLLKELRALPSSEWLDMLIARGRSDAIVRALIFEGRDLIDTQPERAELYFDVAARLADQLTMLRREFRMTLVGRAWLELANARRQLGRYTDALSALDVAERWFEGEPYATKELGRAWLAHGTILFKIGDLREAERYLHRAVNIFAAVDDHRRIARVRMVEAGVFFERSDFAGAREHWLSAAPALEAAKERHSLAIVWLNIGWCDLELNDAASARCWLEKALQAFTHLGCDVEVIRTRWCLARLTAIFENRNIGVRALAEVRTSFERHGLFIDAGMVSLDIAEALLLPPNRPKTAAQVCASLPELFRKAGATREAMKAITYLQEAARTGKLRVDDVKHVRVFLDRADERGEQFVAPGSAG